MTGTRCTPWPRRIRLILDVLMIAIVVLLIAGFCYLWYATATGLSNLGE